MISKAVVVAVTAFIGTSALAQQTGQPTLTAPKTKLEAFTGTTGVVSIKGYTNVGTLRAGSGRIDVTAMVIRNAVTGQAESGVAISVAVAGEYSRPGRSFLDYDEIQGLLDGIDYIFKLQRDVTDHPFSRDGIPLKASSTSWCTTMAQKIAKRRLVPDASRPRIYISLSMISRDSGP